MVSISSGIEWLITTIDSFLWSYPLLPILTLGGIFLFVLSRGLPLVKVGHAFRVLTGQLDRKDDEGEISHYKALSVALAATIGIGNIAAVAVAVKQGGPGIVFWMWMSAIIGMATKYFTCSLAVMYRGRDKGGEVQGGPMYVIEEGLGKNWRWLAVWFAVIGLVGCLPLFTANQLAQATREVAFAGTGFETKFYTNWVIGGVFAVITAIVLLGGLKRLAAFVGAVVPIMVVLYFVLVAGIFIQTFDQAGAVFGLILTDAFRGEYLETEKMFWGSALGGLIVLGVQRATFSNEAGIGTAPMAHGSAKTSEPVHEGLVAMLGPVIDTLIVCTLTAFALLVTGVWQSSDSDGVTLAADAFNSVYTGFGGYLVFICILFFGLSTLMSYAYFGIKCFNYLFKPKYAAIYLSIFVVSIVGASLAKLDVVFNLVSMCFALMAFPTMISTLILSPKVVRRTREYFQDWNARRSV